MCRSAADGGRRCQDTSPSREPANRSATGKAKRRRQRYTGPTDLPCTAPKCADGLVKVQRKGEVGRYDLRLLQPPGRGLVDGRPHPL